MVLVTSGKCQGSYSRISQNDNDNKNNYDDDDDSDDNERNDNDDKRNPKKKDYIKVNTETSDNEIDSSKIVNKVFNSSIKMKKKKKKSKSKY